MLETKAVFKKKDTEVETTDCVVDKVVRLPGAEFDRFSKNLMREWDFIRDNIFDVSIDKEGRRRCLLVVNDDRNEGILVDSEGSNYARYSAYFPNAENFLTVGQYPALAALNKKLTDIVGFIAEQGGAGSPDGRGVFSLQDTDLIYGIDLMTNTTLLNTILGMLEERPEIKDWELDKDELIVYWNIDVTETHKTGRDSYEKPSVMDQIRAARQTAHETKVEDERFQNKNKGGPEL